MKGKLELIANKSLDLFHMTFVVCASIYVTFGAYKYGTTLLAAWLLVLIPITCLLVKAWYIDKPLKHEPLGLRYKFTFASILAFGIALKVFAAISANVY